MGRFCRRPGWRPGPNPSFAHSWRSAFRNARHPSPFARLVLRASAKGTLGTVAFVQLSQQDNGGTEQTGELRMLEASRKEIQKKVDDDDRGISRLRHSIILFVDVYIWEPLCTGLRFLHLVGIFIPVVFAVPAIWIGPRRPDRDNERSGTLWWYGFLVKSMELAGPAFIKVLGPPPHATDSLQQH